MRKHGGWNSPSLAWRAWVRFPDPVFLTQFVDPVFLTRYINPVFVYSPLLHTLIKMHIYSPVLTFVNMSASARSPFYLADDNSMLALSLMAAVQVSISAPFCVSPLAVRACTGLDVWLSL